MTGRATTRRNPYLRDVLDFAPSGKRWDWPNWTRACASASAGGVLSMRRRTKARSTPDFELFCSIEEYIRNTMDLDDLEAMARFPPVARP